MKQSVKYLLSLLLLLSSVTAHAASDTVNPLTSVDPTSPTYGNSSYAGQVYNSLSKEDANRWFEQGFGNWVSQTANANACLGTTGAGLTMTPVSCVAYNAGYRSTETGSITFPNLTTTWVAMDENTSGANAGLPNFVRVTNTHYLTDHIDGGATTCTLPGGSVVAGPCMAADSQLLMKVTTFGGSITAVNDERRFISTALAALVPQFSFPPTSNLAMGGFKFTGNGVASSSGEPMIYQQNHLNDLATATGPYNMGGFGFTNLPSPFFISLMTGFCTTLSPAATTNYCPLNGGAAATPTEALVQTIVPIAVTLSQLHCKNTAAEGGGNTDTFTLRVNGSNSTATCAMANATSCNDVTHSVTVTAGQSLSISDVTTGTPNARNGSCAVQVAF